MVKTTKVQDTDKETAYQRQQCQVARRVIKRKVLKTTQASNVEEWRRQGKLCFRYFVYGAFTRLVQNVFTTYTIKCNFMLTVFSIMIGVNESTIRTWNFKAGLTEERRVELRYENRVRMRKKRQHEKQCKSRGNDQVLQKTRNWTKQQVQAQNV